jgi:cytochrome P450 monooxygenase
MELVAIIISTVVAVALSILYPRWRRDAEIRAIKKRHGCKDPAKYPHEDKVLGSDMVRLRAEAMKDGRFFKLYESQFEQYGRTFEEIWRGKALINTTEPANVQQVAALSFEDYGKDPERLKAQSPFFGPSIFSDGPIWKHARAMVKPIFARAEISDIDHLASFADRFMELLPHNGSMVDVQPLLHRLVCVSRAEQSAFFLI